VVSEVFDSDRIVAEYAQRKADGVCQLCNRPAPFRDRNGEPFLEIHHIIPLEEGGQDTIGNVVALCPNCHRKMHELNLTADVVRLKNRAATRD
jgi:5-methylcytosine-specific restriction enzyme A